MRNDETHLGWQFHNGTKHPGGRLFEPGHRYEPGREPRGFKRYAGGATMPLPLDRTPLGAPALQAIAGGLVEPGLRSPDLGALSRLLYFSAGVTKRIRGIPFRAAACTGALYHIELYVVCADLDGLGAGVYHYDPGGDRLHRLRPGDHRAALVAASGGETAVARAPVILVFASAYWRNAFKYQARAYRHAFWDSGTILSNALAMAAAHGLAARVVMGFADAEVDRLLGLESQPEFSLALLALGEAGSAPPAMENLSPIEAEAELVPGYRTDYPPIQEMHRASSLANSEQAAAWRGGPPEFEPQIASGTRKPLSPPSDGDRAADAIEDVILRRGSTRRFANLPITRSELATTLDRATRALDRDYASGSDVRLYQPYLIVNAVEGLQAGAYAYHVEAGEAELLRSGEFRGEAGHLGLNQALPADASVNVYFLTDLGAVFERYGNRGYRAAQLEAAVAAGRGYLAAYAQRFGATGLTFYDDAVTRFFSPHAAGKSVLFLLALGHKDEVLTYPS